MKPKIVTLILTALFILANFPGIGQTSEKDLKKEIEAKAMKEARKEAKKLKKEGYFVAPGAIPMEKQLESAWMKQYEKDEDGLDKYIVVTGQSVGETQTAAKMQADETAKLQLASQISSRIAARIDNSITNKQLNAEEAASVTKTVAESKNIIVQQLGRIIPLLELYRKIDKNVEANVRIAYSQEMAMETAKKALRKELEDEGKMSREELDKLLDF